MRREHVFSNTPWEEKVAYARAMRVGNLLFVSGTTASDQAGNTLAPGDAYGQAKIIFQKIDQALRALNASLADVVRTRMYVTDITQWESIGRAHHEAFELINPCATMVEVARLVNPEHLVEIEVDAMVVET